MQKFHQMMQFLFVKKYPAKKEDLAVVQAAKATQRAPLDLLQQAGAIQGELVIL